MSGDPHGTGEWEQSPQGDCLVVCGSEVPWGADVAGNAFFVVVNDGDQPALLEKVNREIAERKPARARVSRPAWRTLPETYADTGEALRQDYCYIVFEP